MRGRYFRDISIVRADNGDRTVPVPEENEVVIYRSYYQNGDLRVGREESRFGTKCKMFLQHARTFI
jgi:hypothetical protein